MERLSTIKTNGLRAQSCAIAQNVPRSAVDLHCARSVKCGTRNLITTENSHEFGPMNRSSRSMKCGSPALPLFHKVRVKIIFSAPHGTPHPEMGCNDLVNSSLFLNENSQKISIPTAQKDVAPRFGFGCALCADMVCTFAPHLMERFCTRNIKVNKTIDTNLLIAPKTPFGAQTPGFAHQERSTKCGTQPFEGSYRPLSLIGGLGAWNSGALLEET